MIISNSNLLIYTGSNKELGEQYKTIARTEDWRRIVLFDDDEEKRAAMLTLEYISRAFIVLGTYLEDGKATVSGLELARQSVAVVPDPDKNVLALSGLDESDLYLHKRWLNNCIVLSRFGEDNDRKVIDFLQGK